MEFIVSIDIGIHNMGISIVKYDSQKKYVVDSDFELIDLDKYCDLPKTKKTAKSMLVNKQKNKRYTMTCVDHIYDSLNKFVNSYKHFCDTMSFVLIEIQPNAFRKLVEIETILKAYIRAKCPKLPIYSISSKAKFDVKPTNAAVIEFNTTKSKKKYTKNKIFIVNSMTTLLGLAPHIGEKLSDFDRKFDVADSFMQCLIYLKCRDNIENIEDILVSDQ
jgi:hypothetical protein